MYSLKRIEEVKPVTSTVNIKDARSDVNTE